MLGAIAGDIIGSVYEFDNVKRTDFEPLFHPLSHPTDDTILTLAIAEWLVEGAGDDLPERLKSWFRAYPQAGYGGSFVQWADSMQRSPYGSWGNGSAMRVSPVGFAFETLEEVLLHARRSAEVTLDHPEGIKGAQATAAAIFLARHGNSKEEVKTFVADTFHYDLSRSLDDIRPDYAFDVSCQGTVPQAIQAFLESTDFENAVRLAISLGGDSDTLACITGGIAQAYYGGVPDDIAEVVWDLLNDHLAGIVREFIRRHP